MKRTKDAPQLTPVGIWIRVSTEDQAQGDSPEHHEKRARYFAEAKGWRVVEVYRLEAVSGKSVKDHPEAKRMLADVELGRIKALIFSKLARLARNTKELLEFADYYREHDADLVSLQESIDTSSPAGRLFYTMIAAMAQWEREEIAERVAASVPIRAKLGKTTGGQAPFGYEWKDGKLLPHPDEAPIRKLLYELFKEHKRKKTVARLLNDRGYRTRKGSKFSDTTVARLIADPTAKGVRRANYTKTSDSRKAWKLKPESDWVFHPVPPIISEELWAECYAILERRKGSKPPGRRPIHLFTGVTYCTCGAKMYVTTSNPNRYVCSKCRNKIPIVDLEGVFHEQLKRFFFSPDEIAAEYRKADEQVAEKEKLLAHLEAELPKLKAEMDKVLRLYLDDKLTVEGFGAAHKPLETRHKELEDEIPKLQAELDLLKIGHLARDEIVTSARDLYTNWPTLPFEERRQVVETIVEKIAVGNGDIEINLLYLPQNQDHGRKATRSHGFIAATSWKRAG
jgi:site-specific DNA recombinase